MEWVRVSERMPKEEDRVLLYSPDWGPLTAIRIGYVYEGRWYDESDRVKNVTHWMPLPPPPEK